MPRWRQKKKKPEPNCYWNLISSYARSTHLCSPETWHSVDIKFNFYEWIAFVCRARSERTIYGLFIPFKGNHVPTDKGNTLRWQAKAMNRFDCRGEWWLIIGKSTWRHPSSASQTGASEIAVGRGRREHTSVTKFAANEAEINCEIIYLSVNGVGCACLPARCISQRLSLLVRAIIKSLFLLELINVNWRFRINSDSGPRTTPSLVGGAPTSDPMHVFD